MLQPGQAQCDGVGHRGGSNTLFSEAEQPVGRVLDKRRVVLTAPEQQSLAGAFPDGKRRLRRMGGELAVDRYAPIACQFDGNRWQALVVARNALRPLMEYGTDRLEP